MNDVPLRGCARRDTLREMASPLVAKQDPVGLLEEWLRQQMIGDERPQRVEARQDEDAEGRPAWYLVVTLPVPSGSDTWPVEAVAELDRRTRDKALELGVPWPWYLSLRPDQEDGPADEDVENVPDE
jgi:hypothetical protein